MLTEGKQQMHHLCAEQAKRFFAARGRGLSPETAKRQFLAVLEKVQD
jgi:hypothetical protein